MPKVLTAFYELRNNRAIGHVSAEVSPHHMDAEFFLRGMKWVMGELVRNYSQLPLAWVRRQWSSPYPASSNKSGGDSNNSKAEQPCAFVGLSAPSLAAAAPFLHLGATCLKRLRRPKPCSTRPRALYSVVAEKAGLFFSLALCGLTGAMPRALACGGAVGLAGIALVGNGSARGYIRPDVEQGLQVRAVRRFTDGQVESDQVSAAVRLCVEFWL